jgi:DNA invertase Pin-like site-specific DNA recombinase
MHGSALTCQHTENQIEQLKRVGCERIFQETASGGQWNRPELQDCLKQLRPGDVLVVWKLDRLSLSLSDLLRILEKVDQAGASFKSLTETLDTTGACGRLMMHMLASFNQFEREIIKERTNLGLRRARAAGRIGGGRFVLSAAQQAHAVKQILSGEKTQTEVAEIVGVSKATISRLMAEARRKEQKKMGLL